MSVGRNIKYLRESRSWSIEKFSQEVGISVDDCKLIEMGERVVSSSEIQRICRLLEVSIDELFKEPTHYDDEEVEESGSVLMPVDKLQNLLDQMK